MTARPAPDIREAVTEPIPVIPDLQGEPVPARIRMLTLTAAAEPRAAMPEQETMAGVIRPMKREDIPAVVALRRQMFHLSEQETPVDLAAYFDRIFFDSPASGASPWDSFVYEDEQGRLGGFLGVITHRMVLGNRSIRVGVGTQLMVSPNTHGFVGRRLTRALYDLRHDLIFSDAANAAGRRVWEMVGGDTSMAYSLSWYRPLRPLRFASMRASLGLMTRGLLRAARPLIALVDTLLAMREQARPRVEPTDITLDLSPSRDIAEIHSVLGHWKLRPAYTPEQMEWTLGQVSRKSSCGPVRARLVRDERSRPLGFFAYAGEAGAIGQVIFMGARKHAYSRVLAHLLDDAHARGLVGLEGRMEPSMANDLAKAGAYFAHKGPWALFRARDPELRAAIESGGAFLSRLEGEWWLSF
jgi:hypothetical protein